MKKILFIVKNENEASSRFRVFAYLPYLENDFEVDIFFSEYNNKKVPKFLRSFIKRLRFLSLLFKAKKYAVLFMQRPMSSDKSKSTFFESLLSKINKNIIFDFDDALFIQNETKIVSLIKLSKTVICGNQYLADFALKHNKNIHIIPTTTDTTKFKPIDKDSDKITIGWTGTSGNYANFTKELINTLKDIVHNGANVNILFICDKEPPAHFDFSYQFIKWNSETEVEDLQKIDIGLMPLIDSPWTKGKCGFKLIQYGSIGIASVGSNVGVNSEIILDNQSGYLINNESEWLTKITLLVKDEKMRRSMGANARRHIEENYSTAKNYQNLKKYIL
jgi:glycosyltransferase involved in cell wall biosynthesis